MAHIEVNEEVCKGCGLCVEACPFKILRLSDRINSKGYHPSEQFAPEKCTGCKLCAMMCPDIAIKVFK